VAVKLQAGRFVMPKALASTGYGHLIRWYCESARPGRWAKVQDYASRIDVTPARIHVQYLGYRWGYTARGALLYLHRKTILLPARIAEYVVVHEMAHLLEQHRTPELWRRAKRAMPDFERRKV
jgi:predicted metal-dependent hydrolase